MESSSYILDLSCCGWERHASVLLFRAGRKMFRVCQAKSAGCFSLFFLYFSTFSSWSRLPIRKKGCLGRPSHSTIMNLFWWARGLTEYNCSVQLREKSCSFYHGEEITWEEPLQRVMRVRGGVLHCFHASCFLQNLLLAKPLGLLSLLDEQSAFPQVCMREEAEKILWELIQQWISGLQKKLLGWSAGRTEMSPCVTYETGHPDQEQSSDIGIPERTQEKVLQETIAQPRILVTLCFDSICPHQASVKHLTKSALLQATDKTFVDKLNSSFKGNLHFQPARGRVLGFSIIHYAGKVCIVCRKNVVVVYVGGGGSVARQIRLWCWGMCGLRMTLTEVKCSSGLPPRIPWDLCKRHRKKRPLRKMGHRNIGLRRICYSFNHHSIRTPVLK